MRSLLVSTLVLLAGCDLYFSDGDDQPPCANVGAPEIADNQLRNPNTGQCESFGFDCDFACGPCPDYAQTPNWGSCFSTCSGLDETSCAADPTCHVTYNANSNVDEPPRFRECWALPPFSPTDPTLPCEALDATGCTSRNDCIAMYDETGGPNLAFNRCVAEQPQQTCYSDEECGAGTHCSVSDGECLPCEGPPGTDCPAVCTGVCVPDSSSCEATDCAPGTHCEEQCTVEPNGPVTCSPTCVPDNTTCAGTNCPPGTQCQEVCAEDPNNPGCGTCSVQCVPLDACEAVADEPTCQSRSDCNPIYVGTDCTCYENGTCECEVLSYDHCERK